MYTRISVSSTRGGGAAAKPRDAKAEFRGRTVSSSPQRSRPRSSKRYNDANLIYSNSQLSKGSETSRFKTFGSEGFNASSCLYCVYFYFVFLTRSATGLAAFSQNPPPPPSWFEEDATASLGPLPGFAVFINGRLGVVNGGFGAVGSTTLVEVIFSRYRSFDLINENIYFISLALE